MMHVGNNTTEESNWAIKRTKKVHGVIEHIEKQFQKYFSLDALVAPTFRAKHSLGDSAGCGNFSKRYDRKGLSYTLPGKHLDDATT
jgi:hypothetical protein